eukprot:gene23775-25337_t
MTIARQSSAADMRRNPDPPLELALHPAHSRGSQFMTVHSSTYSSALLRYGRTACRAIAGLLAVVVLDLENAGSAPKKPLKKSELAPAAPAESPALAPQPPQSDLASVPDTTDPGGPVPPAGIPGPSRGQL